MGNAQKKGKNLDKVRNPLYEPGVDTAPFELSCSVSGSEDSDAPNRKQQTQVIVNKDVVPDAIRTNSDFASLTDRDALGHVLKVITAPKPFVPWSRRQDNVCPIPNKLLEAQQDRLIVLKCKTFEETYAVGFKYDRHPSGHELVRHIGVVWKQTYFTNMRYAVDNILEAHNKEYKELEGDAKVELAKALIVEILMPFYQFDLLTKPTPAFSLKGAPKFEPFQVDLLDGSPRGSVWIRYPHVLGRVYVRLVCKLQYYFIPDRVNSSTFQYFYVNNDETQIMKEMESPEPGVPENLTAPAAAGDCARLRSFGDYNIPCGPFEELSIIANTSFAHDVGDITAIKGLMWKGEKKSNPSEIGVQVLEDAGWKTADDAKKRALLKAFIIYVLLPFQKSYPSFLQTLVPFCGIVGAGVTRQWDYKVNESKGTITLMAYTRSNPEGPDDVQEIFIQRREWTFTSEGALKTGSMRTILITDVSGMRPLWMDGVKAFDVDPGSLLIAPVLDGSEDSSSVEVAQVEEGKEKEVEKGAGVE